MACAESNTHSQIPRLPAISTVGLKLFHSLPVKAARDQARGYINRERKIAYIIRAFACLLCRCLRLLSLSCSERERERLKTAAAESLANFQLQYKAQITLFPNLKFLNCFLNSFVAEEDSGKQRKKNPSGVLYVWQSSRWCWRAVSQWILLSIPLELFLLFSQSLLPFCRFPLVKGSVPLS